MKISGILFGLSLTCAAAAAAPKAVDAPRQWIDPETGHRVVRLSDEAGSESLYFNFNAYTPQGDKMVFSTPSGITAVDLKTFKLHRIVSGKVRLLFAGRKYRTVYYEDATKNSSEPKTIYVADIDTGKSRVVAKLQRGTIQAINADETLLGGVEELAQEGKIGLDGVFVSKDGTRPKGWMRARVNAKIPMNIFTIDLRSGKKRIIEHSTAWLNHLLFSPIDPNLLMFCHEGNWQRVDRIWLIRLDQADAKPQLVHARAMQMEIAGHEWFSQDGKYVWYDLQTPIGEDFWVAGYEIATGKRVRYHLDRNEWSVHFNSSYDGTLFSGDGGDDAMVAHAPDGKWLYLFRPQLIENAIEPGDESDVPNLIHPGVFAGERLVNMKDHNYRLEPNANFTPDGKWLVFRSNMFGGVSHVFAVEVEKPAAGREH